MEALVVEDEFLIRILLRDLLEEAGLDVQDAETAEAALDILASRRKPFPVLVTDINLGPGMNGVGLANEVLRRWPEQAVVYVTANPDYLEERRLGPREHVVAKPFETEVLVNTVRQMLGASAHALIA